jgi:hypothetical protein
VGCFKGSKQRCKKRKIDRKDLMEHQKEGYGLFKQSGKFSICSKKQRRGREAQTKRAEGLLPKIFCNFNFILFKIINCNTLIYFFYGFVKRKDKGGLL